ncbi:protein arginine methyltransferase NDUFAF7, mitochondrial isoform X2 [Salminus brasiliensis]|uniref:protein arginine methyltransferase NDUFAF7, mitochondrial isoform X2 n=1 Tax=Salminus brasiliensis TaxID=930266 RepID=UPI003B832F06
MRTLLKVVSISRTCARAFTPMPGVKGLPVLDCSLGLQSAVGEWTGMQSRRCLSSVEGRTAPSMLRHLISKITATGPITVAEYMREVLTNPVTGYYVKNDMLGADGDFITSPEISQMFGELIGIWCVSEWMAAGKPKEFQLVELGPGRGSLTSDILRVFGQLQSALNGAAVSVHLVEVSPKLSQVQAECLAGESTQVCVSEDEGVYRTGTSRTGLPISWYHRVEDVPRGFSIFLAHEFFDALPIHKFQKTEKGWREVMIDIDPEDPEKLRFVVFPAPTLASTTLIPADEKREHVEVCPDSGIIVQKLANRIVEDGGAAMIADYGHDGTKTDTFRVLLRNCHDASTRAHLIQSYDMLTNPERMGHRFQFFSLLSHSRLAEPQEEGEGLKRIKKGKMPLPVAGFTHLGLQ